MTEGTRSVLIGAHSVIHSYYVWKAWKILYKKYPTMKEAICILLHDLGYLGMNYYTHRTNAGHAELGARIAGYLFGDKYKNLILGHSSAACKKFGIEKSVLEYPDNYSWLIAPMWWLRWNKYVENYINSPEDWRRIVEENLKSGNTKSGTELANELRNRG